MTDSGPDRLADLEQRVEALSTRIGVLEEQNEWLEGELKRRDQRIADLERRLDRYDELNGLFARMEGNAANKPQRRAGVLIKTLYNEADASNGRASMDATQAQAALGGSVSRPLMYPTFDTAVELVGARDVVWVTEESRASNRNTRLEIDLSAGAVPDTVAGVAIAEEAD
jgi:predicted RNase H-like nuclease (RuvC/YqgF family)